MDIYGSFPIIAGFLGVIVLFVILPSSWKYVIDIPYGTAIIGSLLVSGIILITLYAVPYAKSQSGLGSIIETFSITNGLQILYYFLPYALFLFGVISDGVNRKVQYFPGGFIALLAVYVNYVFAYIVSGGALVSDTDFCGIPGMSKAGSNLFPQNVLYNSVVLSYIAGVSIAENPGGDPDNKTAISSSIAVVLPILQIFLLYRSGCFSMGTNPTNFASTGLMAFGKLVLGLVLALTLGFTSGYFINKSSSGQTYTPPPPPPTNGKCWDGSTPDASGNCPSKPEDKPAFKGTSVNEGQCSRVNEDGEFVCQVS